MILQYWDIWHFSQAQSLQKETPQYFLLSIKTITFVLH